MIPAGFMAKTVHGKPDWIAVDGVLDINSVSNCISDDFCDYIKHWKHNGYWLFNSPDVILEIATAESIDLLDKKVFYYEVFEKQFDEKRKEWVPFEPESSFQTSVTPPQKKHLEGYDVVNFCAGSSPECSPLSCNGLAAWIPVNAHCLILSFEDAKHLVESGAFEKGEPGPYRIFAVYSCAP
jgi:hypothetical protein